MIFDYVYANLYAWYYRMVLNYRKVDPKSATSTCFGIWGAGCFLFFFSSYEKIARMAFVKINPLVYGLIGLLTGGIVDMVYAKNDRYQKVYEKFIVSRGIKFKTQGFLLSVGFIFLPLMLWIIMVIVLKK
jgi:hypothetical protein